MKSSYTELDYDAAHEYVEKMAPRGYYWDGWDIVRWVPQSVGEDTITGDVVCVYCAPPASPGGRDNNGV